jgi:hypothetical protein
MNPDDLARILDDLGKRLGPTGEYVFALAVRQQLIEGFASLAVIGAFVLLATIATFGIRRWFQQGNAEHSSGDGMHVDIETRLTIYALTWMAALIAILFFLGTALSKVLNPEYAAIRDILGAIRP